MPSNTTRYQIVLKALKLAGRDLSLRGLAEELLNDLLRDEAFSYKYQDLRKTGTQQTLSASSTTSALPSDVGAGTDNLLFGDERTPIYEVSMDEFVFKRGFPSTTQGSGRPTYYAVDFQAGNFVFNVAADKDYGFIPVYYSMPTMPVLGATGDSTLPWFKNDRVLVQMLVAEIYQYVGDPREQSQFQKVDGLLSRFRRGSAPMGGGSTRVLLARNRFK